MRRLSAAALTVLLGGCSVAGAGGPAAPPGHAATRPAVVPLRGALTAEQLAAIPDAVPRIETRTRNGNPPFYDVLGRRYTCSPRQMAMWSAASPPGTAPASTASVPRCGEPYDMYAMTAAHKTLPIALLCTGHQSRQRPLVVVRINDRGPFVANRLIDLSYTAAAKLDMLRNGTAMVEVRVITPGDPTSERLTRTSESPPPTLYVQAGAFAVPANAQALLLRLQGAGVANAFVRAAGGRRAAVPGAHGPVASVTDFDLRGCAAGDARSSRRAAGCRLINLVLHFTVD